MGEADNEGKLSLSIFLSKKNLAALVLTLLLALKESLLQPWSLQHHFLISLSKGQITSEATLM